MYTRSSTESLLQWSDRSWKEPESLDLIKYNNNIQRLTRVKIKPQHLQNVNCSQTSASMLTSLSLSCYLIQNCKENTLTHEDSCFSFGNYWAEGRAKDTVSLYTRDFVALVESGQVDGYISVGKVLICI